MAQEKGRDFKETRRLKRERDAAEGEALAKKGRMDGGDKREKEDGGATREEKSPTPRGIGVIAESGRRSNPKPSCVVVG